MKQKKKSKDDLLAEMFSLELELIIKKLQDPDCDVEWSKEARAFMKEHGVKSIIEDNPKMKLLEKALETEVDELPNFN